MSHTCHDCGVTEDKLHKPGCDMEHCPFCGGQLISCECCYEYPDLRDAEKYGLETVFLSRKVYENGLDEEQSQKWEAALERKSRVPYIVWPIVCARCGKLWPELFSVPDAEWNHYIQRDKRHVVLCRSCYEEIKSLIDEMEN